MSCEYGANLILLGVVVAAAPVILTAAAVTAVGAGTAVAINAAAHAVADAMERDARRKAEEERRQARASRRAALALERQAAEQQRQLNEAECAQRAALQQTANTLDALSARRDALAKSFAQQSNALSQAVVRQAREADDFRASVAAQQARGQADVQQLLGQADRMQAAVAASLDAAVHQLHTDTEAGLRRSAEDVAAALAARDAELDNRLAAINDRLERRRVGADYARTLLQQALSMAERLREDYTSAEARVRSALSLDGIRALQQDSTALLAQDQPEAALTAITGLMQQVAETSLRLDQVRYEFALTDQQLEARAALLRELAADTPLALPQDYTDGRRDLPRDAAYWCPAGWTDRLQEARSLLARTNNRSALTLTDLHTLTEQLERSAAALRALRTEGQARLLCCSGCWDVMRNAVRAFQATGWEWKGFGYEKLDDNGKWDYRAPMVARFTKVGGARADLILEPGCEDGQWGVQVRVDRSDDGVIDEKLRAAQRAELEQALNSTSAGKVHLHCVRGTEGKNSAAAQNRNRLPSRRRQESN